MQFILIIHIILAILMIGLILIQQGKGADAGASMGGSAGTVFGGSGSGSFLSRLTAIFTTLFFITSIVLAILAKNENSLDVEMPTHSTTTEIAPAANTAPAVEKTTSTTN